MVNEDVFLKDLNDIMSDITERYQITIIYGNFEDLAK